METISCNLNQSINQINNQLIINHSTNQSINWLTVEPSNQLITMSQTSPNHAYIKPDWFDNVTVNKLTWQVIQCNGQLDVGKTTQSLHCTLTGPRLSMRHRPSARSVYRRCNHAWMSKTAVINTWHMICGVLQQFEQMTEVSRGQFDPFHVTQAQSSQSFALFDVCCQRRQIIPAQTSSHHVTFHPVWPGRAKRLQ